jgi:uncharacterized protein with HEPN domain
MRFLSRDWRLYWNDMRDSAAKIARFTAGMDQISFTANELVRDAVLRNLEVIGEAAKHIPANIRVEADGLDWRRISGFRDVVAHAYFGIDEAILWNIVSVKVPELIAVMNESDFSS